MPLPHRTPADGEPSSSDRSRRSFLRSVGAGALVGIGGAGGIASAQTADDSGPALHGIADYTLEPISHRTVTPRQPTVEFRDDGVVVEGAFLSDQFQPRQCGYVSPSELYVNETTGRLGVIVSHDGTTVGPQGICYVGGDHRYRLEVVPEGDVPDVVEVQETWPYGFEVVEHRDGPPVTLPDGVGDSALSVGDPADAPDLERDPTVTFGDGEIVVEGTHDVDAADCHTIDVVGVEYADEAGEHLAVELAQQYQQFLRPGEECPEDRTALPYELTLTLSDGLPERVTIEDEHALGQRTTVDRSEPPTLPDVVEDLSFVVDDHPTPDYLGHEVADVVRVGEDELVVEGAFRAGIDGPAPGVTEIVANATDVTAPADDGDTDDSPEPRSSVHVSVGEGGWAGRAKRRFCPLESRCFHPYRLHVRFADEVPDSLHLDVDYGLTTASEAIDPSAAGPPAIDGTEPLAAGEDLLYRDVTGDGSLGQTDVVRFFQTQHRDVVSDYPEYYDFTGDGSVGHGDVVELFEDVATR